MQIPSDAIKELKGMLSQDFPEKSFTEDEILDIANRITHLTQEIYKQINN